MQHVLTLIAGSRTLGLDHHAVSALCAPLIEAGAIVGSPIWLEPGVACDIPFEGAEPAIAERLVRDRVGAAPLDVAAQNASGRRKMLLVADMESTIVTGELLDELAAVAGVSAQIVPITARSMRGEIDFAQSLRERVALLAGQPRTLLGRVAEHIEFTPGALRLVRTMRGAGAYTALVSGGFDCFAAAVAKECGFDEFQANRLIITGRQIAGRVAEPVLDQNSKRVILERLAADNGIPLEAAAAVGDGANDIPMLQAAGLGVAFRGKPAVTAAARFRLDHSDLTGLLYLQGYHSHEFKE